MNIIMDHELPLIVWTHKLIALWIEVMLNWIAFLVVVPLPCAC